MQNFTQQKTVKTLRILYPLWMLVGIFSIIYIPSTLIETGNTEMTIKNISDNELLFRIGIVGRIIVQLLFIVIPLLLYKLLKHIDMNQALLMLVFALVSVPITLYNEANQLAILSFIDQPEMVANYRSFYNNVLLISFIFWGLWLFPLGRLVFISGYFPKVIGVFLYVGGIGYLLSALIEFFNIDSSILYSIAEILTIGEVLFILWFVIKGIKLKDAS